MSLEVVFEAVESRCLLSSSGSEFHAAWEEAHSPNFVRRLFEVEHS